MVAVIVPRTGSFSSFGWLLNVSEFYLQLNTVKCFGIVGAEANQPNNIIKIMSNCTSRISRSIFALYRSASDAGSYRYGLVPHPRNGEKKASKYTVDAAVLPLVGQAKKLMNLKYAAIINVIRVREWD